MKYISYFFILRYSATAAREEGKIATLYKDIMATW